MTGAGIAVVAPAPIPPVYGGAERLWWGFVEYLNRCTEHTAELIKLPTPERDLWEVIEGYERFAALDLSGYDAVVAGKYPAWIVAHPNLRVYLQHRLRGVHDTYPTEQLGTEVKTQEDDSDLEALLSFMQANEGRRDALEEAFARLRALRDSDPSAALTALPGPLSRRIVHWLDDVAFAPGAVAQFSAQSQTVRDRAGYFPSAADVRVAYPMTHLQGLQSAGDGHLLAVSRLDAPKRLDLVVTAMRASSAKLPLLVAGTGPEEARLRELAGDDPRIRLLGHVGDEDLVRLYNDARAVVFVPDREDFGYITLEAMLASKPVLTTQDAGGPAELVRDGIDGLVVDPTPKAVADALERLASDRRAARRMGREGRERVRGIGWNSLADAILAP